MAKTNTEFKFPVCYFQDNLIFNIYGDCWAAYEMISEEYDMLSENGKEDFILRLGRFIANVGSEAKILIVPIKQELQESKKYELGQIERGYPKKGPIYDYAKAYVNTATDILEEGIINMGGSNDYKVYVITKLEKPNENFTIKSFLDNPFEKIESLMGINYEIIKPRVIESYKIIAQRYQKAQSAHFTIKAVDSDIVQWLIGRIFLRGRIEEPYIRKNRNGEWKEGGGRLEKQKDEEVIKGSEAGIMNLYNYRWKHKGRNLIVTDEDGNVTYQTFLSMSHMPTDLNLPGDEWLKPLLDLPFGIEICLSIRTNEFKEAIKTVRSNRQKIEGQDEHAQQSGEVSDEDIEKAYVDTLELEDDIKIYNDPLVDLAVTIALANTNEENLQTMVMRVKQEFERLQFRVQRPASDTLKAFFELIPGSPVNYMSYMHKTSPQVVATSVFPVAIESGDDVGHFIATAGERGKYIFVNPANAIRQNRSGGMAILGTLGGGKSVLANTLAYLVTLLDGGRMLVIDPKSERDILWKGYLKEFEGEIGVTKITYTDKGVFDPFVIYKPESEAWFEAHKAEYDEIPGNAIKTYADYKEDRRTRAVSLADAMFSEQLNLVDGTKRKLAFQEALEHAAKFKKPSMELVIRILAGNIPERLKRFKKGDKVEEEAQILARELTQLKNTNRLAALIIGDGSEKGLSFSKKINIMQIQGLNIPAPNIAKSDYSVLQKTSATIMIPLGEFAKEFIQEPLYFDTPKAVIFDESWFLKSTAQGALLYSEIARTGRSFFAIPIFIGHSVSDVDEPGIRESLTYLFIFRMATEHEAKASLKMLQLEETKENISIVMSLGNGQCLFKDFNGRVQRIQVELLYENIKKAFETNPEKRQLLYEELRSAGEWDDDWEETNEATI